MGVVPPAGAISCLAMCSRAASQDNAAVVSLEQAQVMVAFYRACLVNNVNPIGGSCVFRRVPRIALDTCGSSRKLYG